MFGTDIDSLTRIVPGLQMSRNFALGHLTSGAYHYQLGKWLPMFGAVLRPGMSTIPTWQVASNLSAGSRSILESLTEGFGQDLIVRSAFSGRQGTAANVGQSFEIQVDGFQRNMFKISKDIQDLAAGASELQMVFGSSSFMRIGYDPNQVVNNAVNSIQPKLRTIDEFLGIAEEGLTSLRGT